MSRDMDRPLSIEWANVTRPFTGSCGELMVADNEGLVEIWLDDKRNVAPEDFIVNLRLTPEQALELASILTNAILFAQARS